MNVGASMTESLESASETYIDDPAVLRDFVDRADRSCSYSVCSIDTEADSMHSYETKLCLIQFSLPGALAIIDPLTLGAEGLTEFVRFVDRFEVV